MYLAFLLHFTNNTRSEVDEIILSAAFSLAGLNDLWCFFFPKEAIWFPNYCLWVVQLLPFWLAPPKKEYFFPPNCPVNDLVLWFHCLGNIYLKGFTVINVRNQCPFFSSTSPISINQLSRFILLKITWWFYDFLVLFFLFIPAIEFLNYLLPEKQGTSMPYAASYDRIFVLVSLLEENFFLLC